MINVGIDNTRKIFLDCGSNIGSGFDKITKIDNINNEFEKYLFEPNIYCVNILKEKYNDVTIINKAVWDKNEQRNISLELWPEKEQWIGGGSNILESDWLNTTRVGMREQRNGGLVDCIDFSQFIFDNFSIDDYIILKLDIEVCCS